MRPPLYFEDIRQRAAKRWDQLDADPELAGPWHQLFMQVQSPRHILSELLQNADDAGATEALVRIQDHWFIFTHNGADFTAANFASLCRFGYSDKRALHTIGFRGIGFKSTFSLGDTVELSTPSLSVAFERTRFTEPKWLTNGIAGATGTCVRVAIRDGHREREVEKNLQEWLKSPVSLLFFKHIRRLQIGDQEIHWGSLGPGPVPETHWMALHSNPDDVFLVARSEARPFPDEALTEIKQERLLSVDQGTDFPPCKVEIVLGAKGRLYVVLPTGVETKLPFACNAPFIQDPARLKIKDPETSPTNRWLLERVGELAASVMLQWLGRSSTTLVDRSRAYGILPDVDREDNSLEGTCAAIAEEVFDTAISNKQVLLTNAGDLKLAKQAIIIPEELFEVWPIEQAALLLDSSNRPALSRHISTTDSEKLVHWGLVEKLAKESILAILQVKHLPKPDSWRRLLKLWAYVAPDLTGYRNLGIRADVRIIPVQGKEVLYSANEVVRLGEKRLLQSEEDWEFLATHLLVLNQYWPRYLAEQRRTTKDEDDSDGQEECEAAFATLASIGLEDASDVSDVVDQVASKFFKRQPIKLQECIRLAQIAAKLGATVGESFFFVTRDKHLHAIDKTVLFDREGSVEAFFPASWCETHLLHPGYVKSFQSCTSEEWLRWVSSGDAGLLSFVPLLQMRAYVGGRQQIEKEVRRRNVLAAVSFPYKSYSFCIDDWDFGDEHWRYWETIANGDAGVWGHLVECIFSQSDSFWSKGKNARALQFASNSNTRLITDAPLIPSWILKLRDLPCLPDTRGCLHRPEELLRRTPATESLMDVEPFVHGLLDRETTRPLLTLLGVRDMPTGPERLLACLRSLAQSDKPPLHEVEKWYRRLLPHPAYFFILTKRMCPVLRLSGLR
jgi:hypothetical protein